MKCSLLCLAILVASSAAVANPSDLTAIVGRFCEAQISGETIRLRELLTDDLTTVIDAALARNATIASEVGADNAPLSAGVPYRSMAEMPVGCRSTSVSASDNVTIVDILFEASNGERWTDQLVMRPDAAGMRIDDILFATFPTDTYRSGLRRVLGDTFDN